jgi:hypothetical protein
MLKDLVLRLLPWGSGGVMSRPEMLAFAPTVTAELVSGLLHDPEATTRPGRLGIRTGQ